MNLVKQTTKQPSNVAVYFHVRDNDGEPVPGLTADRFRILEDGTPISATEAKQTILNPDVAAIHYTLLLLDLSGSVTETGELPALQGAAQQFATRVEKMQKVAVYAFDGSQHIIPVVPFDSTDDASTAIEALASVKTTDPSTNLHGAVVEAIRVLQQGLAKTSQPLKFGTLVVFTDGTDRAARVSRDAMLDAVDASEYDVFTVGVGNEIDRSELKRLGVSGAVFEPNPAAIGPAFERVAKRVENSTKSYYLLSYCSPARAGTHELRIEATATDGTKGALGGLQFNATGFVPGCDPAETPAFNAPKAPPTVTLAAKKKSPAKPQPKAPQSLGPPEAGQCLAGSNNDFQCHADK